MRIPRVRRVTALAVVVALAMSLSAGTATGGSAKGNEFVKQAGAELRLHGKVFRFAGASNYYLMYKSRTKVDDVLNDALAQGFDVMRIWGSLDIGDPNDPATSLRGPSDGVYFQSWDPGAGSPSYNDGTTGLEHLDYVIAKAGQLGLKLVIPFVNNWNDFGGMDQYVRWRDIATGGQQTWYHDSFYTDPVIQGWYQDWISHLLNRTNSLTGVKYKDDPTIMTWELGNEPRCQSAGAYQRSPSCSTDTLIEWADTMSTYIKSIDPMHLVSVGDEGFYCLPNPTHWTEGCGEGVDTVAFATLPNIDVMSFHMYPDYWGTDVTWGVDWIKSHFAAARALGKPAMLGEFGLKDKALRNPNYKLWLDTAFASRGAGALYWILSGIQDDGSLYPDYDGFTVYCPSPVCTTVGNFGVQMAANQELTFAPVADHDSATTAFDTVAALDPPANDVAYGGASIEPASLDLDPVTAGQQASVTVGGGTFAALPDGTVTVTPTSGFVGKAVASYLIRDTVARWSNTANLTVTVLPDATAAIGLVSFETGIAGWGSQGGTGSVATSTAWASDGVQSLQISVGGEGWFGGSLAAPVDVSGKSKVELDLQTLDAQTYRKLSIKLGDGFTWCEQNGGGDGNTPANTVATISIDLTNLTCAGGDLTKLQAVNIYLQPGTFRIDNIRAE